MYKLTKTTAITRIPDGASIPADPKNSDYAAYLKWVSEGNAAAPADVVVPAVPTIVEMAQARLALLHAGYLATVNTAIAAMPGAAGDAARIEWEFRATVERSSALVAAMGAVLQLGAAQLDALFMDAATR
jgi:hypothetical protein